MKRAICILLLAATARAGEYPYCQILDRVDVPAWDAHVRYDTSAEPDNSSDGFGVVRLNGGGGLLYLRGDYGALDISGIYDARYFSADGEAGLPEHVFDFHADIGYVLRNANGQAVQAVAHPGLYSELGDLSTDDTFMPFDVRGIQAINEQLSLYLGAAFFPGFEQNVDPRFGARYAPNDEWLLDIAYPETRITYMPETDWELYAGMKRDQTTEWRLDEDDPLKSLRYYESRAYLGVNAPIAPDLRVMCQAGRIFSRTIDFSDGLPEFDVDDAWFLSVGVGGSLE